MKMELLSPSGDIESLKYAINNGADAVYLGLQNFNARRSANNFNEENIKDYVKYCHLFNVKVYVTLNTNIKDNEIDELKSTILACKNARIDAFIITDFLTAKLVKELTNIPLHASTQLGVNNLYGAKYLEKLGFTRVVLARETKLEDIKAIKENTNLEIEYFVHGALCVSYSGQCLFSSMVGGDSANRGLCKQPCRQLYKNLNNNEDYSYLLSTKDLCLIDKLSLLEKIGIDSLKIEGRLKRAEYVGIVTNAYRKALDNIDNEKLNYGILKTELKKIYNRGEFTKGYLFNENVMYNKTQNHIGEYSGKIVEIRGNNSVLNCKDFNEKNGYKIFRNNKEIAGGNFKIIKKLNNDNVLINYKGKINDIFRVTTDINQIEKISNVRKLLNIEIFAKLKKNQKIEIVAKYKNICINIQSEEIVEKAKNTPINEDDVKSIFNKIGNYPIKPTINIDMDNDVFVRLSILNNLKKDVYKIILDKIINENESILQNTFLDNNSSNNNIFEKYFILQNNIYIEQNNNLIKTNIIAVETNNSYLNIESLSKINILVINLFDYNLDNNIIDYYNNVISKNNLSTEIYLKVPTILNYNDLKIFEEILYKYSNIIQGLYINTICGIELAKKYNLKIFGGVGLNIYNSTTLSNIDLDYVTLSAELNNKEIKNLLSKRDNIFIYSYGNLPLMTFAHCTNNNGKYNCKNCDNNKQLTFKDKKYTFNILRTKVNNCYFTLYNSFTTNIIDFCKNNHTNIYIDMLQYTKDINIIFDNIINNNVDDNFTLGHLNRGVK